MKYKLIQALLITPALFMLLASSGASQDAESIALVEAVLCEDIQDLVPQNATTVFSIERQKASCFTAFDPVPKKAFIYHHWFHRDNSVARIKLTLKPPRWSTYSNIQLRAKDIGPWRVEITDAEGNVFHVLRFSVTE